MHLIASDCHQIEFKLLLFWWAGNGKQIRQIHIFSKWDGGSPALLFAKSYMRMLRSYWRYKANTPIFHVSKFFLLSGIVPLWCSVVQTCRGRLIYQGCLLKGVKSLCQNDDKILYQKLKLTEKFLLSLNGKCFDWLSKKLFTIKQRFPGKFIELAQKYTLF